MANEYDVWSPENIKRFQAAMGVAPVGSKYSGLVGPKTKAAMGTQKGANWLMNDYNTGLAKVQPIVQIPPQQSDYFMQNANTKATPYEITPSQTVLPEGTVIPDWTNAPQSAGLVLSSMWDNLGGAKGFADLAGGLASIGGMYSQYQANKMAKEAHDAQMGEYNRQVRRDQDFAKGIAKSGLGSYSAG